jgi:cytosine/adenosine deaminase-related metal-dependent hydrolase
MLPARDPLRSLVYTAADRAVHSVFVDGRKVVDAGRVLTLDHAEALGVLTDAQARMMAAVPQHDWAARRAEHIAPLSLPSI